MKNSYGLDMDTDSPDQKNAGSHSRLPNQIRTATAMSLEGKGRIVNIPVFEMQGWAGRFSSSRMGHLREIANVSN